ncbi:MAG TPA: GNAT family N-acetyltransferase, partial [Bryobacteraceae bacterium]|nr:GNAT family N-acetyltransferase [Bryobacteraceae bacterium]
MPSPSELREILRRDRGWSLYALGDLAPGYFEHSEWHSSDGAVVLVYRAATPPVLFAMGDPKTVARLAAKVADPRVYLHVRPKAAEALAPQYRGVGLKPMWRMLLDPARFRPEECRACTRLGAGDASALDRLYADGREAGEAPDFFFPSMLEDGVFFGVRKAGELVAAAGTHLAVPAEGVAAIGNVYTRRDHRGRGLAGALTSAVT